MAIVGVFGYALEFLGILHAVAPILMQHSQIKLFLNIFVVALVPTSFNLLMLLPPWILLDSMTQHVEEEMLSISKYSTTEEVRDTIMLFEKYQKAFNLPTLMNLSVRYETRK